MFGRQRRRWANTGSTLGRCVCLQGRSGPAAVEVMTLYCSPGDGRQQATRMSSPPD